MNLRFPLLLAILAVLPALPIEAQTSATNIPPVAPTDPAAQSDPARPLVAQAMDRLHSGNVDGAMPLLDEALRVNPRSVVAHVLRGSIESSKKHWAQAETEFAKAEDLAPNDHRIKFMLADTQFASHDYARARLGYVALQDDPDTRDLALYNIFLCDLFGGHPHIAKHELVAFKNQSSPGFYYASSAWDFSHGNVKAGQMLLADAERLFPPAETRRYAQQLKNGGAVPSP